MRNIRNLENNIINKCLKDPKLSWKAKGIFIYLYDNPVVEFSELLNVSKDGRTAVQNALSELRENGYLNRFAIRDDLGRFSYYLNIPRGYKISEEEALQMSNPELLAYYIKTKEQFPISYIPIIINVKNEIKRRGLKIIDKEKVLMDYR